MLQSRNKFIGIKAVHHVPPPHDQVNDLMKHAALGVLRFELAQAVTAGLDVAFLVLKAVLRQPAFGGGAVTAPRGAVHHHVGAGCAGG